MQIHIYMCVYLHFPFSYTKSTILAYYIHHPLLWSLYLTRYPGDHAIILYKYHLHSFLRLHSILLYKYTLSLFNQSKSDGYLGFEYFSVTKSATTSSFMQILFVFLPVYLCDRILDMRLLGQEHIQFC